MKDLGKWRRKFFPVPKMHLRPHQLVQSHFEIVKGDRVSRYTWSSAGKRQYQDQRRKIRAQPHGINSLEVAWDAIRRGAGSFTRALTGRTKLEEVQAWWEWQDGLTPFFWNWPEESQEDVRDGQPHFLTGEFDSFKTP